MTKTEGGVEGGEREAHSVVSRPKTGLVNHGGIDDGLERDVVVIGEGGGGGVVADDGRMRRFVGCMQAQMYGGRVAKGGGGGDVTRQHRWPQPLLGPKIIGRNLRCFS
jgi:hypothetical protein